ncbi:MAG: hypothetical protein GPOALKHO_001740 [Sodalis sp.]|nr:MAG: hypothetical protein GPOALKHO_001740 [Sodalis sp.]
MAVSHPNQCINQYETGQRLVVIEKHRIPHPAGYRRKVQMHRHQHNQHHAQSKMGIE